MKQDTPEKDANNELRGMTKDDAEIHAEALRRYHEIINVNRDEREQCREDRRFYAVSGAQYDGAIGEQYENKPQIEVNKTHLSIIKIQAAHRENPITCDFVSREGVGSDQLASVCDGLFRSDEQDSSAQEAYDNAFEEAVGGGVGAFRLRTVWEDEYDEDDDRQRIEFEPIFEADQRVFFDNNAKDHSKKGAMFGFVLDPYTPEAYKAHFDDNPAQWPEALRKELGNDWITDDSIMVADYYRVEEERVKFDWYKDVSDKETKYEAELVTPEMKAEFKAIGTFKTRSKTVRRRKVMKYILSGNRVLNPGGERIPGPHIPVVPCYGKRVIVDNVERCLGHVRLAKDIQRLKNMVMSFLAEIASKSPIPKPIFYPEQTAGHEYMWESDAVEDYAYLHINPIEDGEGNIIVSGPVGMTKAPDIPPALAVLLQMVDIDLKDLLGNQQQGEEVRSNISGDVIQQIHAKLDLQEFIYISNQAKSIQRGGEIWLGMAQEVYTDDGRTMKSVNRLGETTSVVINKPVLSKAGAVEPETDLTKAKFNVYTSVGPASSSKKAATLRNITNMMKVGAGDEESELVMKLFAMMNIEGEGMDQMREYASMKLVRMGIVDPSDEQAEKLKEEDAAKAQEPPDANTLYLQAEADKAKAQAEEARAKTETAKATTAKNIADAIKTEAETVAKLADLHPNDRDQVLGIYSQMKAAGVQSMPPPQPEPQPMPQDQAVQVNLGSS